ncbi:MAG: hypothetical protein B6I30_06220 [Desulfobacteraceae bacterium 4572_187]|nr:MAG: hypothetical protein B6I30_06220 [Desulfobacteraceae bacterium 4572_187]RLB80623.1 MAG: hypothetical protein DRH24_10340 [Deltaproteobacteria bacterium]
MNNEVFYTRTMAKVHTEQGNLGKAAEIYKYLLKQEPDRQDFINALSEIENKGFDEDLENLFMLFSEWIDLLLKYNKLQRLKKLKSYIGDDR